MKQPISSPDKIVLCSFARFFPHHKAIINFRRRQQMPTKEVGQEEACQQQHLSTQLIQRFVQFMQVLQAKIKKAVHVYIIYKQINNQP